MEQKTSNYQYKIGERFNLSSISSDLHWSEDSQISDYEFKHRTETEQDTEPFYTDKSSITINDTSADLYAQWEKVWFKFTYDKNYEGDYTDWSRIGEKLKAMEVGDGTILSAPSADGLGQITFSLVHKKPLTEPDSKGNTHIAYLMTTDILRNDVGSPIKISFGSNNEYGTSNLHSYMQNMQSWFTTGKTGIELLRAQQFLDAITDFSVPYRDNSFVTSKFWAPSVVELGGQNIEPTNQYSGEGFKFDEFQLGNDSEARSKRRRGNSEGYYNTRSAGTITSKNLWYVSSGSLYYGEEAQDEMENCIVACIAINYKG